KLLEGRLDGEYWKGSEGREVLEESGKIADSVARAYEERDYARALREIMALADSINEYISRSEPWKLAKEPARLEDLRLVCTRSLQGFHLISVLLAPVLPDLTQRVARDLFGLPRVFKWEDCKQPPLEVRPYQHLAVRIDIKQVKDLVAANRQEQQPQPAHLEIEPIADTISIDDFVKLDLRVARIVNAEEVPGADKLLKLTLDLGGGTRTVFAGIKSAYSPIDLAGRLTVVVANLASRKMKFGVSEGMVLAAGPGGKDIFLLQPDAGAKPGMRIK
ncbi:MAG: methionine--tRNA ligase subunit beta, partial [Deltaproteobacteria bacterium]|nr:methionine--tRNA ligase subunit beta [Deltaproteobacteria bacterium]